MKTALFDFDGVLVDTEPIYDLFWESAPARYGLSVENFTTLIKGLTMPDIMRNYFSGKTEAEQQKVLSEAHEYVKDIDLPPVPGSFEFLRTLKSHGVRTGIVTSSDREIIGRAFRMHNLEGLFDTIVTAENITKGKPDPMCYLLAASNLGADPGNCIVFEDSVNGIKAGNAAGMRVVGLSTTNPAEVLEGMVYKVIPDFKDITLEEFQSW